MLSRACRFLNREEPHRRGHEPDGFTLRQRQSAKVTQGQLHLEGATILNCRKLDPRQRAQRENPPHGCGNAMPLPALDREIVRAHESRRTRRNRFARRQHDTRTEGIEVAVFHLAKELVGRAEEAIDKGA